MQKKSLPIEVDEEWKIYNQRETLNVSFFSTKEKVILPIQELYVWESEIDLMGLLPKYNKLRERGVIDKLMGINSVT